MLFWKSLSVGWLTAFAVTIVSAILGAAILVATGNRAQSSAQPTNSLPPAAGIGPSQVEFRPGQAVHVAPHSDLWPIGQIAGDPVHNGRIANAGNSHHGKQQTNKDPTLRHTHPCALLKAEIQ